MKVRELARSPRSLMYDAMRSSYAEARRYVAKERSAFASRPLLCVQHRMGTRTVRLVDVT